MPSHIKRTIQQMNAPLWARHLTDDDEWPVRTALGNVAADLRRVADSEDTHPAMRAALHESAATYEATLRRIEQA